MIANIWFAVWVLSIGGYLIRFAGLSVPHQIAESSLLKLGLISGGFFAMFAGPSLLDLLERFDLVLYAG